MLKIVIISGGTGSIALQKGFNNLFGYQNYQLRVIINAFDNGKSTGVCRRVFDNQILGPSDLRKNQLTCFEIVHEDSLNNPDSYESKLYNLFEKRYSAENYKAFYDLANQIIHESSFLSEQHRFLFQKWLDFFFFTDKEKGVWRPTTINEKYIDFSLSNIFYASAAALSHYSLDDAGTTMASVLQIPDNVFLVSDISLILKAITKSGHIIEDEGDIVTWDNPKDKIARDILFKNNSIEYEPSVDENNHKKISSVIQEADLLIFSTGTQWSSLIPTYLHKGFYELVKNSKAKKYLIMNNVEDRDMTGVSAEEMMGILHPYLPVEDVTVVINDSAVASMKTVPAKFKSIHGELSEANSKKHNPNAVVRLIMNDFFEIKKDNLLISDLDGTLWNEKGDENELLISSENLRLFMGIILSGNSEEHVQEICFKYLNPNNDNFIYCNYGNTYFSLKDPTPKILAPRFFIGKDLENLFNSKGEYKDKVRVRGNSILTIKPLIDRQKELQNINLLLQGFQTKYIARIAGRTSIDIMKDDFEKDATLRIILDKMNKKPEDAIYLGNEIRDGNDRCVEKTGIKCINLKDVFETNVFLKTFYK